MKNLIDEEVKLFERHLKDKVSEDALQLIIYNVEKSLTRAILATAERCIYLASTHTEKNGSYCDTGDDMDWACRSDCVKMAVNRIKTIISELNGEESK